MQNPFHGAFAFEVEAWRPIMLVMDGRIKTPPVSSLDATAVLGTMTKDTMRGPTHRQQCLFLIGALLVTAATWADTFPASRKHAIYIRVHSVDTLGLEEYPSLLSNIEDRIDRLGRFWAENSGGKVSFRFDYIFDTPIELDSGRHRPEDWLDQVHNILLKTYDFDIADYAGVKAYDVRGTAKEEEQTWAGISFGPKRRIYLQSTRFLVLAHETGHQLGLGHASAFHTSEPTFVWNPHTQSYVRYDQTRHGYVPMPFAIEENVYGHYDSVMGNRVAGHVSTEMKRSRSWLPPSTHRKLSSASGGRIRPGEPSGPLFRVFAHDQLESATREDEQGYPIYGVTETYDPTRLFSLSFDRTVETYDVRNRDFAYEVQEISLEYRNNSRYNGLFFSIDDTLVDVNEAGKVWHLPAEIGNWLDEFELGTSFYVGDDEAFLASNPPAPLAPEIVRPERYLFEIVDVNDIDGHSYIDLIVELVSVEELPPPDIPLTMRTGGGRSRLREEEG